MANIKYLETALTTFNKNKLKGLTEDGSIVIGIETILNTLKDYEIGIPSEYFEKDGVYFGIEHWLKDQMKSGKIIWVCSDNTYDMVGDVSVDFGFAQFDSLVSDETFVLMHIHDGEPLLYASCTHNRYPAILFKFEKGKSFYDILDEITFENPNIPSMTIEINNKHYLVLPRIINESYYVKCIETEEELEPSDKLCFCGNEEDVKTQIETYLRMKKTLTPENV